MLAVSLYSRSADAGSTGPCYSQYVCCRSRVTLSFSYSRGDLYGVRCIFLSAGSAF